MTGERHDKARSPCRLRWPCVSDHPMRRAVGCSGWRSPAVGRWMRAVRAAPRFKVDDDNVELAVEDHCGAGRHDTHGVGSHKWLWPAADIGLPVNSKGNSIGSDAAEGTGSRLRPRRARIRRTDRGRRSVGQHDMRMPGSAVMLGLATSPRATRPSRQSVPYSGFDPS